jgi:hypothetical protein
MNPIVRRPKGDPEFETAPHPRVPVSFVFISPSPHPRVPWSLTEHPPVQFLFLLVTLYARRKSANFQPRPLAPFLVNNEGLTPWPYSE